MILQGNQRGGARDLALHLLKNENEHVEVHEIKGFVSDDLAGALSEAHAISKGTKAKQFLFSLSLNPPPGECVSTTDFEKAIATIEKRLSLQGQPRAIVFHEKEGRRHCHVVWSRIDTQKMKAIPLPHSKRKLMEVARELYVEHGWKMPPGMINPQDRNPRNFTLAQWQQSKRTGKDPRAIKQDFQGSWAVSDNQASFIMALKDRGYILAKGDRRGFVAVDHHCEVYAISKWVGVKTKDINAKLGKREELPTVDDAKSRMATQMVAQLSTLKAKQSDKIRVRLDWLDQQKSRLVEKHQHVRQELDQKQTIRRVEEIKHRQARFRKGLGGLWDRFNGRRKIIQRQNEHETHQAMLRDRHEKDALIFTQLDERQTLQQRYERLDQYQTERSQTLEDDIRQYNDIKHQTRDHFERVTTDKKQDRSLEP